ncbi:MAG: hypothetical protein HY062_18475 [Bacteroidetes bacterium]|nr:hypothetical protein [Bacteroidota bacterium]
MSIQLKHISYIFLLTILSLTLQNTVVSFLKDGSVVKTQLSSNNTQPTEEEDELESDYFHESVLLLNFDKVITDLQWFEYSSSVSLGINTIYTPPPKA